MIRIATGLLFCRIVRPGYAVGRGKSNRSVEVGSGWEGRELAESPFTEPKDARFPLEGVDYIPVHITRNKDFLPHGVGRSRYGSDGAERGVGRRYTAADEVRVTPAGLYTASVAPKMESEHTNMAPDVPNMVPTQLKMGLANTNTAAAH